MNSHLSPLFISYRCSWEKLIKYQVNSSCVIVSVILMTTLFYKALILRRNLMLITLRASRINIACASFVSCTYKYNNVVTMTIGAPRTKQPFPFYLIILSHSPRASQNLNPVHSEILFSQRFFCLPLYLSPCTVPCKIVVASPADLGTCPNHFNQCLTWRRCIACTKTDIREKAARVRKRKSGKKLRICLPLPF